MALNFLSVSDICNVKTNKETALGLGFLLENNFLEIKIKNLYDNDPEKQNLNIVYAFTKKYILDSDLVIQDNKYTRILGIVTDIETSTQEISINNQIPLPVTTDYTVNDILNNDLYFVMLSDGRFVGIPEKYVEKKWQIFPESKKNKRKRIFSYVKTGLLAGMTIYLLFGKTHKS